MTGDDFYRSIPLTEEETEAALLEGKKKKFFKERADLKEQEYGVPELRKSKSRKSRPDALCIMQSTTSDSGQSEGSPGTKANSKGKPGKSKGAATVRQTTPEVP